MVQFIHQEAKEKAAEIKLKTDEEFNIEKLRMVEAEKQKIRADYERKEKQVEVQKRMYAHTALTRPAPAHRAAPPLAHRPPAHTCAPPRAGRHARVGIAAC